MRKLLPILHVFTAVPVAVVSHSAIAAAALTFTLTSIAAAAEDAPEWAAQFGGASLAVVWQTAATANEKIATALAARKLDGVAEWAETIHLAAHAIEDQVKLDDRERRKRLTGALNQAAKIADDVIEGARHNEMDTTDAHYRRLKSALAVAKLRLPKEITGAPEAEKRR